MFFRKSIMCLVIMGILLSLNGMAIAAAGDCMKHIVIGPLEGDGCKCPIDTSICEGEKHQSFSWYCSGEEDCECDEDCKNVGGGDNYTSRIWFCRPTVCEDQNECEFLAAQISYGDTTNCECKE